MSYASCTPISVVNGALAQHFDQDYARTRDMLNPWACKNSAESLAQVAREIARTKEILDSYEAGTPHVVTSTRTRATMTAEWIIPSAYQAHKALASESALKVVMYVAEQSFKPVADWSVGSAVWCVDHASSVFSASFNEEERLTERYPTTMERLYGFLTEQKGWDGADGKPADSATYEDVKKLLTTALYFGLREPDVALGSDGTVGLVWSDDIWYIANDFDGSGQYVFISMQNDDVVASGVKTASALPAELIKTLTQNFMDDDRSNL